MGYGMGIDVSLSCTTSTGTMTIAKIADVDGPGASADMVDVTTMDSTGDFRVFQAGPIDGGEVTATLVFQSSQASMGLLVDTFKNRTERTYTMTLTSTGLTMPFAAFVSGMGQAVAVDDAVRRTVTFKVTKDPGYTT